MTLLINITNNDETKTYKSNDYTHILSITNVVMCIITHDNTTTNINN